MTTFCLQASCLRKGLCTWLEVQGFRSCNLRRSVQVFTCAHTTEPDGSTVVSPMSSKIEVVSHHMMCIFLGNCLASGKDSTLMAFSDTALL